MLPCLAFPIKSIKYKKWILFSFFPSSFPLIFIARPSNYHPPCMPYPTPPLPKMVLRALNTKYFAQLYMHWVKDIWIRSLLKVRLDWWNLVMILLLLTNNRVILFDFPHISNNFYLSYAYLIFLQDYKLTFFYQDC